MVLPILGILIFCSFAKADVNTTHADLPLRIWMTDHRQPAWRIDIGTEISGRYPVSIERVSKNEKKQMASTTFSPEVIESLLEILDDHQKDPLPKWTSDEDCLNKRKYQIKSSHADQTICVNPSRFARLEDFQSAAQLILRDATKTEVSK